MQIRTRSPDDQDWIERLLRARWGSRMIAANGKTFDAASLPALVAGDNEGLATYSFGPAAGVAELVTLDAVTPRQGVGTALLDALVAELRRQAIHRLTLATTNDNLDALRFYQRRGFGITEMRPGAIDAARRLKPSIPEIGEYGIPVRDEIVLTRELG